MTGVLLGRPCQSTIFPIWLACAIWSNAASDSDSGKVSMRGGRTVPAAKPLLQPPQHRRDQRLVLPQIEQVELLIADVGPAGLHCLRAPGADFADFHEAAAGRQAVEPGCDKVGPKAVQHDIDTVSARRRPDLGWKRSVTGTEQMADALPPQRRPLPAACRGQHLRAQGLCQGDRCLADSPSRRVDQNALACAEPGEVFERIAGCEPCDGQCRGGTEADCRRDRHHEAFGKGDLAAQAPGRDTGHHRIARSEAGNAGPHGADDTAAFQAEGQDAGGLRQQAARMQHVAEIEAACHHVDAYLARARRTCAAFRDRHPGRPLGGTLAFQAGVEPGLAAYRRLRRQRLRDELRGQSGGVCLRAEVEQPNRQARAFARQHAAETPVGCLPGLGGRIPGTNRLRAARDQHEFTAVCRGRSQNRKRAGAGRVFRPVWIGKTDDARTAAPVRFGGDGGVLSGAPQFRGKRIGGSAGRHDDPAPRTWRRGVGRGFRPLELIEPGRRRRPVRTRRHGPYFHAQKPARRRSGVIGQAVVNRGGPAVGGDQPRLAAQAFRQRIGIDRCPTPTGSQRMPSGAAPSSGLAT